MSSAIKQLGKDTIIYGLGIVVGRFLTFLLTPLYTHYLAPDELGSISFLYSLMAFGTVLISLGMESAYFKYAAEQQSEQRKVFSNAFFSIILAATIFLLILYSVTDILVHLLNLSISSAHLAIRLSVLIVIFDAMLLIPFAFLRLERKAVQFSLLKLCIIVINVVLNVFFLVLLKKTAVWILIANVVSSGCGALLVAPIIYRNLEMKISRKILSELFRFSLPTIPAGIGAIFLHIGDRPLLKYFSSDTAVGIYQANYRLAIPMLLLISIFDYAWKPFFLQHYQRDEAPRLFSKILVIFSSICCFLWFLLSVTIDQIIRLPVLDTTLIDARYWEGSFIVSIVAAGYYFYGLSLFLLPGIYYHKKTQYLAKATAIAVLFNILTNVLLIPLFDYPAAAIATVVAYLGYFFYLYIKVQKIYTLHFPWLKIILQWILFFLLWFTLHFKIF